MRDKLLTNKARLIYLIILLTIIGSKAYTQTRKQVYNEIVRQGIECPEIVMAQFRLETGNGTSNMFKSNSNLFGMKEAKVRETTAKGTRYGHAWYTSWRQSIADYKLWQDEYYKGEDYYLFLEKLGYATSSSYIYKLKQFKIKK